MSAEFSEGAPHFSALTTRLQVLFSLLFSSIFLPEILHKILSHAKKGSG